MTDNNYSVTSDSITCGSDDLLELRSPFGDTLMHTCCEHGHLDIVLLLHDKCPEMIGEVRGDGKLPVHLACENNHVSIAEKLCELRWGMIMHNIRLV